MQYEWGDATAVGHGGRTRSRRSSRLGLLGIGLLWMGQLWFCSTLMGCATPQPEVRVSSLVYDWFAVLEARTADPAEFEPFLAPPSFELAGEDGQAVGVPELSARRRDLQASYIEVEHRIEGLRIEPAGGSLYEVHFEVERRAMDADGTPHLARRRARWSVRAEPRQAPVILSIDEKPMLPYPGSGHKIVCY